MKDYEMKLEQKVAQIQFDLAQMVSLCNKAENFQMASVAQSCLTQVGAFSNRLRTGENDELANQEFKSA